MNSNSSITTLNISGGSSNLFYLYKASKANMRAYLIDEKRNYNEKLIEHILDKNKRLLPFPQLLKSIFTSKNPSSPKVPFLPLERLNEGFGLDEVEIIIKKVINSGEFTSGSYISLLEETLSFLFGFKNVILCNSGTDALVIALKAIGVRKGDEVIIPPNSFSATENAVFSVGATPILADIEETTYNLCPNSVKSKITPRTKCILPVHLYGNLAPLKELLELSKQHGVKIIEDACQAFGLSGIGELSDATVLSFNPFKNLGGFGKAGAIVTNNDQIAEDCHSFSYHGFIKGKKNVKRLVYGFNSRLDNLQAAIISCKLKYLSLQNFKRVCLAARYINLLNDLEQAGKIYLPKFHSNNIWHLFPIQILTSLDRDFIKDTLQKKYYIETDTYYPILTHHQKTTLHQSLFKQAKLPKAESAHRKLLHMPFHHNLTLAEQDHTIAALYEVFKKEEKYGPIASR